MVYKMGSDLSAFSATAILMMHAAITLLGIDFVNKEKNDILGRAFLSYPPACRVMGLLRNANT